MVCPVPITHEPSAINHQSSSAPRLTTGGARAYDEGTMSLLSLPIGKDAPREVHAVIEIPMGSSNKYEYDLKLNVFVLDRVLFSPLYYPCDYGWVAGTLSEDGDPLDILVLGSHANYPGCVVLARPLGALMMRDEEGTD